MFQRAAPERPSSSISVESLSVSGAHRRQLEHLGLGRHSHHGGRALTDLGLAVVVALAPIGRRPNFVPSTALLASLRAAQDSNLTVVAASTTARALCGNGVCETGERDLCGSDCPIPLLSCPTSASGVPCNGRGWCTAALGSGAAVCVCNALQGYAGSACDQCAPGFAPGLSVSGASPTCVRLEVFLLPPTGEPVSDGGASNHLGVILGVVLGVGIPLVVLVVWAAVTHWRRAAQPTSLRSTLYAA